MVSATVVVHSAEAASEVALKKSCSKKFRNIHRKAPVLDSLFNKVVGVKACNFIKKRFQHRYFSMSIAGFLRTLILKNICERLLLILQ